MVFSHFHSHSFITVQYVVIINFSKERLPNAGRIDPTLGGDGMRPGRKQVRDTSGVKKPAALKHIAAHKPLPPAPTTTAWDWRVTPITGLVQDQPSIVRLVAPPTKRDDAVILRDD